jgi:hypothetical protein
VAVSASRCSAKGFGGGERDPCGSLGNSCRAIAAPVAASACQSASIAAASRWCASQSAYGISLPATSQLSRLRRSGSASDGRSLRRVAAGDR